MEAVVSSQLYFGSISIPPGVAKWKEMLWEANVHTALVLREYAVRSAESCSEPWTEYVHAAESILFQRGIEF